MSKVLVILLQTLIVFQIIMTLFTALEVVNLDTFDQMFEIALLVGTIFTWLAIVSFIVSLIWLYKVHKDLREGNHNYPISPGGSVIHNIIPIYNIYGAWKVFRTIGNYFQEKGHQIAEYGRKVNSSILYIYLLIFVAIVLSAITLGNIDFETLEELPRADWTVLANDIIMVIMLILSLALTKAVFKGLYQLLQLKREIPKDTL
ncbi:DUF4328 domain-containing protein [Desulfuribacillus stibiiarsenatis]|nr:DUF4328 domain-containing protein [Desulfuribacillus stibiiarsenatis]